ncbi:N-acetyltransferase family protein [Amaricoccus macauensis]|uniref:GNAT family N-acetyltransferase n=1 Tax=Amaricoccus macauensis TaxID=57001 RepID=UPI003C7BBD63
MTGDFIIRDGRAEDAAASAAIYNAWVDATPWMPRIHPADGVERFFCNRIFGVCTVIVSEEGGEIRGILAFDAEGYIAVLSIADAARGKGIGAALLSEAKRRRPEGLMAWTFQANEGAQRFYLRQGFREETRTEGENEEGLPDILYVWGRAP